MGLDLHEELAYHYLSLGAVPPPPCVAYAAASTIWVPSPLGRDVEPAGGGTRGGPARSIRNATADATPRSSPIPAAPGSEGISDAPPPPSRALPSPPRGDPHTRSVGNRGVPRRPHRQQPLLRGDLRLASPQNPSASWIHAGSSSPRGGVCLGLRGPGQAHRRPKEQRKTSIPLLAATPARRRGRSATTKERKEEHALRHI